MYKVYLIFVCRDIKEAEFFLFFLYSADTNQLKKFWKTLIFGETWTKAWISLNLESIRLRVTKSLRKADKLLRPASERLEASFSDVKLYRNTSFEMTLQRKNFHDFLNIDSHDVHEYRRGNIFHL